MAIRESYYDVPKKIMSSEVENNKEEKVEEPPRTPLRAKILKQWQIALKVLELVSSRISSFFKTKILKKY